MIEKVFFGKTKKGEGVYKYVLRSDVAEASILTYGATWQSFKVLTNGEMLDVVLGYDDVSSYEDLDGCLGATVGRNSNRIKGGKFTLLGVEYQLPLNNEYNNLHSGDSTFFKQLFTLKALSEEENSITLSYFSPDGEGGFPGDVDFLVKYTLTGSSLSIEYFGTASKPTILNPTNHAYFNLGEDILKTKLQITSSFVTKADEHLHATGEIYPVANTPFDFTSYKEIGKDINSDNEQIKFMGGYDVNYCLSSFKEYKRVATAISSKTGLTLNVYTDRPAVQLYTANFLTDRLGKDGEHYGYRGGFCLETQTYSGAANNPHFPTPFIDANEKFYSKTTYEIKAK